MRTILAVLFVLAICVVGFGFYRGWFALSSPSPPDGSNKVNVNLATDTDKIKDDAKAAKDKAVELTGNAEDDSEKPVDRTAEKVPPNQTPPPDDGQSAAPKAAPPKGN